MECLLESEEDFWQDIYYTHPTRKSHSSQEKGTGEIRNAEQKDISTMAIFKRSPSLLALSHELRVKISDLRCLFKVKNMPRQSHVGIKPEGLANDCYC